MNVKKIRAFNRFYTRILGVFDKNVFNLKYSLLEMRTLGEIYRLKGVTSNALCDILNIDKGYLSRIINKLIKDNLVYKEKCENDKRSYHLYLTDEGVELNRYVESQSDRKVINLLSSLSDDELNEVTASMSSIESILGKVIENRQEEQ